MKGGRGMGIYKKVIVLFLMLFAAGYIVGCGQGADSGQDMVDKGVMEGEVAEDSSVAEDDSIEGERSDADKGAVESKDVKDGGEGNGVGIEGGENAEGDAGKSGADDEVKAEGSQPVSPWAGKKVSICGDSLSTFTGYIPDYYSKFYPENGEITQVDDTWWMRVLNRTGMELCRNASYSGSTVSGPSLDNSDGRYSCGDRRIMDLAGEAGEQPDIIIVLMGANDLLNNIPLGDYDGVSTVEEGVIGTFSEAYALMLDKMKRSYPDAEIYCATIAEVSRWNDKGEKFPFMNAEGLTAEDYNEWIRAIAQAKGVHLIDVYQCGITSENAQEYTSDGTHPNAEGAGLIADKVCEAFEL